MRKKYKKIMLWLMLDSKIFSRSVYGPGWSPRGNPWGPGEPVRITGASNGSLGDRKNTFLFFCGACRTPLAPRDVLGPPILLYKRRLYSQERKKQGNLTIIFYIYIIRSYIQITANSIKKNLPET